MIRLTSRKFLVTVSTVAGLVAAKHYAEAAAVASAFIIGEAHIDAQAAKAQGAITNVASAVKTAADAALELDTAHAG